MTKKLTNFAEVIITSRPNMAPEAMYYLSEWTYCIENMLWEDCGKWEESIAGYDESLAILLCSRRERQEKLVGYVASKFLLSTD